MKKIPLALLVALSIAGISQAYAQDAAQVAPKTSKVIFENEYIRVIRSTFQKGASEPTHTHPAGWYLVTKGGQLTVDFADGKTELWKPKSGESAWDPGESPHTAKNTGDGTLEYIYVEVKSAAPAKP